MARRLAQDGSAPSLETQFWSASAQIVTELVVAGPALLEDFSRLKDDRVAQVALANIRGNALRGLPGGKVNSNNLSSRLRGGGLA